MASGSAPRIVPRAPDLTYTQGSRYGGAGWGHAEYHLVTLQRTPTSLLAWVDGNHQFGVLDTFANSLAQTLNALLTLELSPSNDPVAMDLAEMIVVSDDLHYGERRPFEDYLAAKCLRAHAYGVRPSGHLARRPRHRGNRARERRSHGLDAMRSARTTSRWAMDPSEASTRWSW